MAFDFLFKLADLMRASSPVSEHQLRRDFRYPAGARNLGLIETECNGPTGRYFERTLTWEEVRGHWKFHCGEYQFFQTWEPCTGKIGPSFKRYL